VRSIKKAVADNMKGEKREEHQKSITELRKKLQQQKIIKNRDRRFISCGRFLFACIGVFF